MNVLKTTLTLLLSLSYSLSLTALASEPLPAHASLQFHMLAGKPVTAEDLIAHNLDNQEIPLVSPPLITANDVHSITQEQDTHTGETYISIAFTQQAQPRIAKLTTARVGYPIAVTLNNNLVLLIANIQMPFSDRMMLTGIAPEQQQQIFEALTQGSAVFTNTP